MSFSGGSFKTPTVVTRQPAAAAFQATFIDGATLALATTTLGPRFACKAQATPQVDVIILSKLLGRFQVFVKGLAGHTLVIAGCSGDMLVADFMESRVRVPAACFYLVGAGSKALRGRLFLMLGWLDTLFSFMVGRLRGGSSRPRTSASS